MPSTISQFDNTTNSNLTYANLASRLKHKIIIEEEIMEIDEAGGFENNWYQFIATHAEIKPFKGSEIFSAMQIESNMSHIITIRYIKNLNNKMRIKYQNRYFNILNIINPSESSIILEILAEESNIYHH